MTDIAYLVSQFVYGQIKPYEILVMLQTFDSTVQSLTIGLKIRNSSQSFLTISTASSGALALTKNFNVFALLTDVTLEYPCFNIRS